MLGCFGQLLIYQSRAIKLLMGFMLILICFHHSSYYSMLMNLAIALFLFLHKKINFSSILRYIFIVALSILIFLISSKAGVIVLISLFFC